MQFSRLNKLHSQPIEAHVSMIPKLTEWRKWTSLERASYVAQLATAAAFLISSIFSYMSWQEARAARNEQKLYFISEKAPYLEVKEQHYGRDVNEGLRLTFVLRNTGGSTAKNLNAHFASDDKELFGIFEKKIDAICELESIEKGDDIMCSIPLESVFRSEDLSRIESIVIDTSNSRILFGSFKLAGITVNYDGLFEDSHKIVYMIAINMRKESKN